MKTLLISLAAIAMCATATAQPPEPIPYGVALIETYTANMNHIAERKTTIKSYDRTEITPLHARDHQAPQLKQTSVYLAIIDGNNEREVYTQQRTGAWLRVHTSVSISIKVDGVICFIPADNPTYIPIQCQNTITETRTGERIERKYNPQIVRVESN